MATYLTHTGLTLSWEQVDGEHVIKLAGDNVKLLYRGANLGEAGNVYRQTKEHYEERRKVESGDK